MRERLLHIGLNEEEADLYLALLELGGAPAGRLAKRLGRRRTSTYHTLYRLIEQGLAQSSRRGASQFFSPAPPEKIVELTRGRFESAAQILPELHSLQNSLAHKPKVRFFEGGNGIEKVFEESLSARGEVLGYTNLAMLIELFPEYFRRYTKERMRRKIKVRYLSPRPPHGVDLIASFFNLASAQDFLEVLFINAAEFPIASDVTIFGNTVALMSLSREEQYALMLESASAAKTMKAVFDLAWVGASNCIAQ